jgi:excisionase family DNA binding protein
MEDRWLSVDEIAAYLGIKRDTVYKWIAEKQMPAHRLGRLWKFRKEDVDEWVKAGGADDGHRDDSGKPVCVRTRTGRAGKQ